MNFELGLPIFYEYVEFLSYIMLGDSLEVDTLLVGELAADSAKSP